MERPEKDNLISELSANLGKAQIALCADFKGLTVLQVTKLRRELRNKGCTAAVVKNTLAKRSIGSGLKDWKTEQVSKFSEIFVGTNLVVLSENDPVSPAKVLTDFAKDNEKLVIKGGFFEGTFLEAKGVADIAKMPSREQLIGTLLALINTPATQLLRVMRVPAEQTVRVIEAQRQNLEKKAA